MVFLRAYSGAARVNKSPPKSDTADYTPLTHMVIFVQPIIDSNETYLVDVGFGGTNLAQPILLTNAETNVVWGAAPPERHRLTRGAHPSSSLGKTLYHSLSLIPS
jgi:arylamine N-acetyltransferase